MLSVIVIAVLAGAFARLARMAHADTPSMPRDIWAAFDALEADTALNEDAVHRILTQATSAAGDRAARRAATPREAGGDQQWAPGTVGAMAVGDHGFVNARAAMLDLEGNLWLAAAAVVHEARQAGHVAVRRESDGYHLQRHDGPVGLWNGLDGPRSNARVRVARRFD